jgi:hypothetical protein
MTSWVRRRTRGANALTPRVKPLATGENAIAAWVHAWTRGTSPLTRAERRFASWVKAIAPAEPALRRTGSTRATNGRPQRRP